MRPVQSGKFACYLLQAYAMLHELRRSLVSAAVVILSAVAFKLVLVSLGNQLELLRQLAFNSHYPVVVATRAERPPPVRLSRQSSRNIVGHASRVGHAE